MLSISKEFSTVGISQKHNTVTFMISERVYQCMVDTVYFKDVAVVNVADGIYTCVCSFEDFVYFVWGITD